MNSSVSNADTGNSSADTIVVHDEIKSEILDEESAVVGEGSTKEGMQHGVTCPVSDCAGSIGLLFTVLFGLSSEGSLVNFSFFGSGEGEPVGF